MPALARRAIGFALIALTIFPFWRLLSRQTGAVAEDVVRLSGGYATISSRGSVLALAVAAVAALLLRPGWIERFAGSVGRRLAAVSRGLYGIALAAVSGGLTLFLSFLIWDARPPIVDVVAQLLHARFFAAGLLAGPVDVPLEFWLVANTLPTDAGWVSQYPPGHVALLALGFRLGAVWLVCPVLMAVATLCTANVAERLLPEDVPVARLGAGLFAVSPLLMVLSAAHMNHVVAAALAALAAYCALRARDGAWWWAVPAGASASMVFATRPLSGLVIGAVVTLGVWLTDLPRRSSKPRFLAARVGAAVAGALPLGLAVAAYNAHFFGAALRFGYVAYLGPDHTFGFHPDPFGNAYGPADALGYTASDLLSLGFSLFRSPVSTVAVIGLYLVVARRLTAGTRLFLAWALALIVPLAFYWHHDLLLGPRMLSDAAPAWCVLGAVAAVGLARRTPAVRTWFGRTFSPRGCAAAVLIASAAIGMGVLTPRDIVGYARRFSGVIEPPRTPLPSLVFVHDSWSDRTAARLLAQGMRGDSVSRALERNASCRLHRYATRPDDATDTAPPLVFAAGADDGARPTRLPSGVIVRSVPGQPLTSECLLEAQADRFGSVALMPLVWQGDLPGLRERGAMFVRDLGPADNRRLIERFPGRRLAMLLRRSRQGPLALVPYERGVELLWSGGRGPGGEAGSR